MSTEEVDKGRRSFMITATTAVSGVGMAYFAWPFIASMLPSARAQAAGAPVEVDISKLEPGQMMTIEWRGKPVWVLKRTESALASLKEDVIRTALRDPESKESIQPDYAKSEHRSIKPEILVVVGVCTHLGCSPTYRPEIAPPDLGPEWKGGFFCPCHGSRFDLSGRVYAGVPAPTNLDVPPYKYLSDSRVIIGVDDGAA